MRTLEQRVDFGIAPHAVLIAGESGAQDEAADARGVEEREALQNAAAHRDAKEVGAGNAEVVHDGDDVGAKERHRVGRLRRRIAGAGAAVVEGDSAKVARVIVSNVFPTRQ